MGILYEFLSSFLLGAGAGLALTALCAFLARQFFGIHWIKNTLLSFFLLIFATFQTVLLFGAYSTKGYVDQAYALIDVSKDYVDVDALDTLLPDLKAFIPDELLPDEATDAVDVASLAIVDAKDSAKDTVKSVANVAVGLIDTVNATLNAYIFRRWLWLVGEVVVFFILAGLMRSRRPKYSADVDMFSGSGGSATTTTLNF